jgi:chemotaxis protein MotB
MARGKDTGRYSPARSGGGDDDGDTRWLGTYADAITLLMAFFVMLYAMSEVDVTKFEAFVRGLAQPFDNVAAESSLLPEGAALVGEQSLPGQPLDTSAYDPMPDPAPAPPRLVPDDAGDASGEPGPGATESMPGAAPSPTPEPTPPADIPTPDANQLEQARATIAGALEAAGLADLATYRYNERGLVVSIASDDVLFATGSTVIDPAGIDILRAIAAGVGGLPNDVTIEGHTDDQPLRRNGYTNWNLSTDRAVAVLSLLVEELGLSPGRLGAAGYGEYRPIGDNTTAAGRAANRRVDFLIAAQGA